MAKYFNFAFLKGYLFLLLFLNQVSFSQCPLGTYSGMMAPTSGTTFVGMAVYSLGTYFNFPVLNGGSYAISTCGSVLNTQITGYPFTSLVPVFFNDDNGPLCVGLSASINNYVPNFTDYCRVQVSQFNCMPGASGSILVQVRQNDNLSITSSSAAMCSGAFRTLTALPSSVGASPGGYGNPGTFSGTGVLGGVFTAPIVTTPTNYTITYTFGYITKTQVLTVHPQPTVTAAASSSFVCLGSPTTLNASGASSYTWSGGVSNGVAFTPTTTNTYSVIGSNSVGCLSDPALVTIVSIPLPTVTTNVSPSLICSGNTVTLNGGGATTYTWSGGVTNGVSFVPVTSSNYTVVGTFALTGCTNSAVQSISVNPSPTVTAAASFTKICKGNSVTLNGGGATTYTWNGNVNNGVSFTPTASANYTVTGSAANGCANTATIAVQVNSCVGLPGYENELVMALTVFPNPSGGDFKIERNGYTDFKIVDAKGQIVKVLDGRETKDSFIQVPLLSPGIYFIVGSAEGRKVSRVKLIILE